jgi:hypothetical protein
MAHAIVDRSLVIVQLRIRNALRRVADVLAVHLMDRIHEPFLFSTVWRVWRQSPIDKVIKARQLLQPVLTAKLVEAGNPPSRSRIRSTAATLIGCVEDFERDIFKFCKNCG